MVKNMNVSSYLQKFTIETVTVGVQKSGVGVECGLYVESSYKLLITTQQQEQKFMTQKRYLIVKRNGHKTL